MKTRIETDRIGTLEVDDPMLYGAQTARARENFNISGMTIGREMIIALGYIKKAAARVNLTLHLLDRTAAEAIETAVDEVISGALDAHFPVDVFQSSSGTSSNMNVNEVIANRAIQLLGGRAGDKDPVHPNDHVNLGQSSNNVFPAAIHIAAASAAEQRLPTALCAMEHVLRDKAVEFSGIVKTGRTHLQDAVPMSLGSEFTAFASQVSRAKRHIENSLLNLLELPIGGTAVGTGVNTHP